MRVITSKDAEPRINFDNGEGVLITLELQDKPKIINGKSGDFVVEQEVVETSRVDTQEYIDSFKGQCGIENIMNKFLLTRDPTLFQQIKRPDLPMDDEGKEAIQDYSGVPENYEQATAIAQAASEAYEKLPVDLRDGRSLMKFAETCTDEELTNYIQKLVKAHKEVKEDVK